MPDLISIAYRWWKPIVILTAITTLLSWGVVASLPKQYLSVATALPASSTATDKANIFNEQIQALYPSLGTTDDLDKVEGTARLDTIYLAAADQYKLWEHYGISGNEARYHAAWQLKKNTRIEKSEYGELKIRVWDKEAAVAALLANGLLQQLQVMHQALQNKSNQIILESIKKQYNQLLQSEDSTARQTIHYMPTEQYQKLIAEYELMISTNPPVLLVVEAARPSIYPDKPKVGQTVLISFFAAALFSFLLILLLESKKPVV